MPSSLAEMFREYVPPEAQNLAGQWMGKMHNLLAAMERGGQHILGIDEITDYATQRPGQLGYHDENRGQGDALRHFLLAAELYRTNPRLAPFLLGGHEFITNTLQSQLSEDREQDLYNNEIGRQIGLLSSSREDVERRALMALPKARVLPEQGPYDY